MFEHGHIAHRGASSGASSFLAFWHAMSLHLTAVKDLNRECFFFNLHSFCIFLILSKNLNLHEQKCQTLLLLVLTPQNTFQAPLGVLPTTTLLPYHQALYIPFSLFLFTLYLFKSSFLKMLLPSTRVTTKKRTQRNFG